MPERKGSNLIFYSIKKMSMFDCMNHNHPNAEQIVTDWFRKESEYILEKPLPPEVFSLTDCGDIIRKRWVLPDEKGKYPQHFSKFLDELYSMSCAVLNVMSKIERNNIAFFNETILFNLIYMGEILDETFEKPTLARANIDVILKDHTIISLKLGNKMDEEAIYKDYSMDFAACALYNLYNKEDFNSKMYHIVTKKNGELNKICEYTKIIGMEDIKEMMNRLSFTAKIMKGNMLYKCKGFACQMCDYKNPCLLNKFDDFYVSGNEIIEEKDEDDMPF